MSLFGSDFLLTLLGVNICLTYAVYPTALLGRANVTPIAYMAIGAYSSAWFTTRGLPILPGALIGVALSIALSLLLTAVAGHLRSHFFLAASLGVDPSLVYFYNLTTDGDLLRVKGGLFVLLLVFGGLCFNHD